MKSKGTAYLLWLLGIFGCLGFHRFYLGKIGIEPLISKPFFPGKEEG